MRFKKEEDVKIIPVEMSEIPKVQRWSQKRTKRMLVEEFIASGYEAVHIEGIAPDRKVDSIRSCFVRIIAKNKIRGVKVSRREGNLYLIRTE